MLHIRVLPAWWLRRSAQTRSHPELGRQTLQRQWYYVSRPGRVGRRQACKIRMSSLDFHMDFERQSCMVVALVFCGALGFAGDAGWSSPVARQAHNLKVTGSNPVPATKLTELIFLTFRAVHFGRLFCCPDSWRNLCFASFSRFRISKSRAPGLCRPILAQANGLCSRPHSATAPFGGFSSTWHGVNLPSGRN